MCAGSTPRALTQRPAGDERVRRPARILRRRLRSAYAENIDITIDAHAQHARGHIQVHALYGVNVRACVHVCVCTHLALHAEHHLQRTNTSEHVHAGAQQANVAFDVGDVTLKSWRTKVGVRV